MSTRQDDLPTPVTDYWVYELSGNELKIRPCGLFQSPEAFKDQFEIMIFKRN